MRSARWFLFPTLAFAALARAQPTDLLLVAADDATLQPILRQMVKPRVETRAAWSFWCGGLNGKTVVLTRTEGDPLNAVAATTLALRKYQPRLVVVYGNARTHNPGLKAGDVVVSERFAAFDGMISPIAGLGAGSAPLQWSRRPHLLMTAGEKETPTESFPADAAAARIAQALKTTHGRVVSGTLGSAHQINREADRIAWLRDQWHTSTEDGESAYVAGCATLLGVGVVGFRVIDGSPEEATNFVLRFVESWK